ncbi:MAG: hypothetical protein ABIF82_11235, partial [Planctomycetota bacterium]
MSVLIVLSAISRTFSGFARCASSPNSSNTSTAQYQFAVASSAMRAKPRSCSPNASPNASAVLG